MSNNSNLTKAQKEKNDEFYTLYEDVEKELVHYKEYLKGKKVYCNCDSTDSNFWKYLYEHFNDYELKSLTCTYYNKNWSILDDEEKSYKTVYDGKNITRTQLIGNGSFDSSECIELLKNSDVVISNPPFSLFREYFDLLMKYDKKFLIIGNFHAVTYKNVFRCIKENTVFLGINPVKSFICPDNTIQKFGNICWFTNIIFNYGKALILTEKYSPEKYLKYDNFDAINVDKVSDIPCDYDGIIGVPKTFLYKYCPDQFELVGYEKEDENNCIGISKMSDEFLQKYKSQGKNVPWSKEKKYLCYYDHEGNAKIPFARILIRYKHPGFPT